jgi:hypothetical protein
MMNKVKEILIRRVTSSVKETSNRQKSLSSIISSDNNLIASTPLFHFTIRKTSVANPTES